MADMADIESVEEAWEAIAAVTDIERVVPITYMNSSAALKAFVGRNGGAVCTSSNARAVLSWAFERGDKVLFFPDQHLGRNTGVQMGYSLDEMRVWNPRRELGGLEESEVKSSKFLLWKGHCTIHQRFTPANIDAFRAANPGGLVVVHPECPHETVVAADRVGSTDFIVKEIDAAPAGTHIAVGTEIHLVQRLAAEHPDKTIVSLDPLICPCSTMFRIDAPHLAWVLENLVEGSVVNRITVDDETKEWAKVALERMLAIVGAATAIFVVYNTAELDLSWIPDDNQIIVVHNDRTLDPASVVHPGATHVLSPTNVGFGATVNLGLAQVEAARVVLVNPDVTGLKVDHWTLLSGGDPDEVRTIPIVLATGQPTSVVNRYPTVLSHVATAYRAGRIAPLGSLRRRILGRFLGRWARPSGWAGAR